MTNHYFRPDELLPGSADIVLDKLRQKHRRMANAYPRGSYVEAANSGHYVQFDEPELVISVLRKMVTAAPLRDAD